MSKLQLTALGAGLNVFLFAIKLWAGLTTQSIAVVSDALNSFLDVFSYGVIMISVQVQDKAADDSHPFGHRRAEPLAGLLIAVLAGVLGVNVVKEAVLDLWADQHPVVQHPMAVLVIVTALVMKVAMTLLYRREARRQSSPAIHASLVDSKNDVFASAVALLGFLFGGHWDDVAGVALGFWILISGTRVGLGNLGFLMGMAPGERCLREIRVVTLATPGVTGMNDLRAHYVGDLVHVEIHIEVDRRLSIDQAHDIGLAVKLAVEQQVQLVERAFVHIDPV